MSTLKLGRLSAHTVAAYCKT